MSLRGGVTTILLVGITVFSEAQILSQAVQGKLINELNLQPAEGVVIHLSNDKTSYQAVSNVQGEFRIEKVTLGRYLLSTRSLEFGHYRQELLVVAGRSDEVVISLTPAIIKLDSVVVKADISVAPARIQTHQFSIEQIRRLPAVFFDPARAFLSSTPGMIVQNDQNNNIIVNGKSPNYIKWMLEGANIVNPNHLANAGTLTDRPTPAGGGVNILSAQMLGNSQFHQPPYSSYFGNASSGIVHMDLRPGSHEHHTHTAQASLLGLEAASEGPLNEKTSYAVNGRYSTVGLLTDMGLDFGGERINFYDLAFTLHRKLNNGGDLKFFGFGGQSINEFNAPDKREDWEEDKDSTNVDFNSEMGGLGLRLNYPLPKGHLSFTTIASGLSTSREVQAICGDDCTQPAGTYQWKDRLVSSRVHATQQLSQRIQLHAGVIADYKNMLLEASEQQLIAGSAETELSPRLNGGDKYWILSPYASTIWITQKWTVDAGLRWNYTTLLGEGFWEPRMDVEYRLSPASEIVAGFNRQFQYQSPDLLYTVGNGFSPEDTGPAEVYNFMLGSQHTLGSVLLINRLFYDDYRSVPEHEFSEFNRLNEFVLAPRSPDGIASTYGYNVTVQRAFVQDLYFISSLALFNSVWSDDHVDSRFNGGYTFSFTGGKEFRKEREKDTKATTIGTRLLYSGGLRESSVDPEASLQSYRTVYDNDNPFSEQLNDYFRMDLRISWRREKEGKTRTLSLDVQNLLSIENDAYSYYDFRQGQVVKQKQLGIIPILVYRVDF